MASAYHDEPQDDIMGIVDELVGEDGDMMAAASSHRHYQTAHRYRSIPKLRVALPVLFAIILLAVVFSRGKSVDVVSEHSVRINGEGGRVIEFTVAQLNTNSENCTYVKAHQLECIPEHTASTNKFRIQLNPCWAPIGAQRFEDLTVQQFWDDARIFRVVPNFVSQFGLSSYPSIQNAWTAMGPIDDDPVVSSNTRGTVTFASAGKRTRTTQIFINTKDNTFLDDEGFAPIGEVLEANHKAGYGGMDVVDEFFSSYGEQPDQGDIQAEGLVYLSEKFPKLSFFVSAEFVD